MLAILVTGEWLQRRLLHDFFEEAVMRMLQLHRAKTAPGSLQLH